MDLESLRTSLTINLQNFAAGMQQASNMAQSAGNQISNNLGRGAQNNLNNTSKSVDHLKMGFKDLERIVGGILISQFFYNMTNDIQQSAVAMGTFMNNMARAQIQMTYFLGSTEKAQAFIQQMQDFAASTAMNTEQALALSTQLMNSGFRPEEIKQVMGILNDASVVGGGTPEMMNRIVIAIQQIRNTGKLMGQDLRQLAQAGLPVYDILSKQLGIAKSKLLDLKNTAIDGQTAVYALLRGMQERYHGAAQKVAQTVPGLWQNIVDDSKIVGSVMFAGPYKALQNFLASWKGTFDTAKKIVRDSGIGGLLNHFVPPQLQNSVRRIIGSIESLGHSFMILAQAMRPVVEDIMIVFTVAMGQVLPIIAALVRGIANFIAAAMNASPVIRYLAVSIGTLMVATVAGRAMMFLWRVTRIGVICTIVAKAVQNLGKALAFMNVILTKSKLGIILTLVAAILYLALSSKTASAWLGSMMDKIASLAGFNTKDILKPNDATNKWLQKVNKSLDSVGKNLGKTATGMDNAGKAGKKAGKKIKDTFVASFDELFQVPQKLDELSSGFGGIASNLGGALGNLGNVNLGGLPDATINPSKDSTWNLPPWMKGNGKPDKPQKGGDIKFPPTPWDANAVVTSVRTINNALARLRRGYLDTEASIKKWVVDGVGNLDAWASDTVRVFDDWVSRTESDISGWVDRTSSDIAGWVMETVGDFSQWAIDGENAIRGFAARGIANLSGWAHAGESSVYSFVVNTEGNLSRWATNTRHSIGSWASSVSANIAGFASSASQSIANFATNTSYNVSSWVSRTSADIRSWVSTNVYNFNSFGRSAASAIGSFGSAAWSNLKSFLDRSSDEVGSWASSVWKTISSVSRAMGKSISDHLHLGSFHMGGIPHMSLPGWAAVVIGGVAAVGRMLYKGIHGTAFTPGYATGGIIDHEQIARLGEGGKREAVIPLENSSYMKPFSTAVAHDLFEMFQKQAPKQSGDIDTRPILYVGTLIADERSLRELNRKMRVIDLAEKDRGAYGA